MGSSARLQLDLAPGGLVLAQELVNTSLLDPRMGLPDLLATLPDAEAWLGEALRLWSDQTRREAPSVELTERDLPRLRALREAVRALVLRRPAEPFPTQTVDVELGPDGVEYRPAGAGWRLVASVVGAELLLARHTGTFERLKSCENPTCGAAFYDRTRNGSRVWHDTKTCGNVMNLRASRARRRGASGR